MSMEPRVDVQIDDIVRALYLATGSMIASLRLVEHKIFDVDALRESSQSNRSIITKVRPLPPRVLK